MPKYHNNTENWGLQKRLVREILRKARDGEISVPTLGRIWYLVRPKLLEAGVIIGKHTRRTIQYEYPYDICRKEWGIKRASLGIHIADRVQAYHRGKEHNVSPENMEELAKLGIAHIAIEKEGLAAEVAPFAVDQEVVLLDTRGFNTESGEEFFRMARNELGGKNIAAVNDFDAAGVLMCKQAGVVSLGIDLELIEELGLNIEDVDEPYNGSESTHWKSLHDNYPDYEHLDYLAKRRIEIDNVLLKLEEIYGKGVAEEKFWKAICARFVKEFPTRNYAEKLIDVETLLTTPIADTLDFDHDSDVVDKLNNLIKDNNNQWAEEKRNEIKEDLENYHGLPEIKTLEEEKKQEFNDAMEQEDEEASDIHSVCEPILEQLTETIDERVSQAKEGPGGIDEKQAEIDDLQKQIDDLQKQIDDLQKQIDDLETEISDKEDEIDNEIITPLVEQAETEQIIPAIKKLDEEKGYSIVEDAGLEDEEEKDDDEVDEG